MLTCRDMTRASVFALQTAKDLIDRIQEHEARLLEETAMRRSTEYKKLGVSPDHVSDALANKVTHLIKGTRHQ